MSQEELPVGEDPEREARVRKARRGILLVGVAFYFLLIVMCLSVFFIVFVFGLRR